MGSLYSSTSVTKGIVSAVTIWVIGQLLLADSGAWEVVGNVIFVLVVGTFMSHWSAFQEEQDRAAHIKLMSKRIVDDAFRGQQEEEGQKSDYSTENHPKD